MTSTPLGDGGLASNAAATLGLGLPSAQLQQMRRQARVELRAAVQQLNSRGLYYSSKWAAELLCQIDLTASSTTTSALTSAMNSRLHSTSKTSGPPGGGSALRGSGTLAPPSFAAFEDVAPRRQTISTQLFGTPGGPLSAGGVGSAAVSAFPPLAATPLSPIAAFPHAQPADAATPMHDTPPVRPFRGSTGGIGGPSSRPFMPESLSPSPPAWDDLAYAKSLFDLKEFARAAHVLRDVHLMGPEASAANARAYEDDGDFDVADANDAEERAGPNGNANLCLFLRCYALYLAGEKRKEEETLERNNGAADGPSQAGGDAANAGAKTAVVNRELRGLQSVLAVVLQRDATSVGLDGRARGPHARFQNDGFLWFMYGLVLRDLGLKSAGRQALLLSVTLFPWNWSAWQALAAFQRDRTGLEQTMTFLAARHEEQQARQEARYEATRHSGLGSRLSYTLPSHPPGVYMKEFFYCDVLIQLQSNGEDESLAVLDQLCALFPDSVAVRSSSAMAYYNKRAFPESQHLFELLLQVDPFRWEHMDTFSNILYVRDDKPKLSWLAHQAFKSDKYRLQTCCIVGNYYSSRGDRERAILYFKRALRINPNYLSAWTLMGHEYVELRNTSMAIESYRKAIDINPLDYRAWYGLGQTYEIMQMNQYSIYYFKKACEIKPYDPRMWCAIGENYEKLSASGQAASRIEDAIHCYLRAEAHDDVEGVALNKLAQLYRRRGQIDTAAAYYRKVLQRHNAEIQEPQIAATPATATAAAHTAMDTSMASHDRAGESSLSAVPGLTASVAPIAFHGDAVDAMLFLAEFELKHARRFAHAEAYCNRLVEIGGPSKDAAQSLLIEIRQLKAHRDHAASVQASGGAPRRTPLGVRAHAPLSAATTPAAAHMARSPPPPPHSHAAHTPMRATSAAAAPSPVNVSVASSTGFFDSPS